MISFRGFVLFAGGLSGIFGVALVLVPGLMLTINGATTDATGLMIARLCGAMLIELGLTQMVLSGVTAPRLQKGILASGLIGTGLGGAITVAMVYSGAAGLAGLGNTMVFAVLFVGFLGLLRRKDPSAGA